MAIKMITPFKDFQPGQVVTDPLVDQEWLVSRGYAERVEDVLPPLQDPQPDKALTTREKKPSGKK